MDLNSSFHLFVGIVVWILIFYLSIKLITKLVRGDFKRSYEAAKKRGADLETDYTWRRLKVAYIVLSMLAVAFAAGLAYNSTVQQTLWGTYTEPSMERGYVALILGTLIAWFIYRYMLPRLYQYLKR